MRTNNVCAVIVAVEMKVNFARSLSLFLKVTIGWRTKFNSSLGMENDDKLYGFSADKVM